jgi:hypothetical protein
MDVEAQSISSSRNLLQRGSASARGELHRHARCHHSHRVRLVDGDGNLVNLLNGKSRRLAETLDDDVNSDALLDEWPDLLEDLGSAAISIGQLLLARNSQKDHRGGAVTDLGVLRAGNVHQSAGGRVNNVEELEQGSTVVWPCQQRATPGDSLEMVAWPRSSTMSLSMPRGPSVVAMVCATARQAEMFDSSCPMPCEVSVPSV